MQHAEVHDLDYARFLVEVGEAQSTREAAGYTRAEFVALADHSFSVAALRAWEGRRRRPRGAQGVAYGRTLRAVLG